MRVLKIIDVCYFFFSSRRRHTRLVRDWSSDVCSSDLTGLRRDQTKNREDVTIFQLDHGHGGILKINPIVDWTWDQIQEYIKNNNLPYNSLLDKGFPSIGCEPCTRAIKSDEDIRAGRWWWEQDGNKECGLHIDHK